MKLLRETCRVAVVAAVAAASLGVMNPGNAATTACVSDTTVSTVAISAPRVVWTSIGIDGLRETRKKARVDLTVLLTVSRNYQVTTDVTMCDGSHQVFTNDFSVEATASHSASGFGRAAGRWTRIDRASRAAMSVAKPGALAKATENAAGQVPARAAAIASQVPLG